MLPEATVWEKVVPAALGLAAGILGTFVAPWVNWGIEKRRERQRARRESLARWRAWAAGIKRDDIERSSEYVEVYPYLSWHTKDMIDNDRTVIVRPMGIVRFQFLILEDLNRLEEKWAPVDPWYVIWRRRIGRVVLWYRRRRAQELVKVMAKVRAKAKEEKEAPPK